MKSKHKKGYIIGYTTNEKKVVPIEYSIARDWSWPQLLLTTISMLMLEQASILKTDQIAFKKW